METWKRITYPKGPDGKKKKKLVECRAYTEEEAKAVGIKYAENYRVLTEPGWFKCDTEDMVCYCFKIEPINVKNKINYVRTAFRTDMGTLYSTWRSGILSRHTPADYRLFRAGGFQPIYTKNQYTRLLRKNARWKAICIVYAGMVVHGQHIDLHLLAKLWRPSGPHIPTIRKILRYAETKNMIEQEMRKQFEKNGVTVDNAIAKMEEAYAIAKGKKDAQSMIRVAENYLEVFKKNTKQANNDPSEVMPSFEVEEGIKKAEAELAAGAPKSLEIPDNAVSVKKSIRELEEYEQKTILEEAEKLLQFPQIPVIPKR